MPTIARVHGYDGKYSMIHLAPVFPPTLAKPCIDKVHMRFSYHRRAGLLVSRKRAGEYYPFRDDRRQYAAS